MSNVLLTGSWADVAVSEAGGRCSTGPGGERTRSTLRARALDWHPTRNGWTDLADPDTRVDVLGLPTPAPPPVPVPVAAAAGDGRAPHLVAALGDRVATLATAPGSVWSGGQPAQRSHAACRLIPGGAPGRPAALPPGRGTCAPETARMRLGYDRARTLIKAHTGLELHQLRHSAATHLGDAGVDVTVSWPRPTTAPSAPPPATPALASPRSPQPPNTSNHPDAAADQHAGARPVAARFCQCRPFRCSDPLRA